MKRCWDLIPNNRPNSIEIKELIDQFYHSLDQEYEIEEQQYYEIEKQFNETQEFRKENLLSIKNNQLTTHTQAIYLDYLTLYKESSKYDTMEITDFTNFYNHYY
ncbi:hypothetical protein RhiirA5_441903 [Rhizophagus irregularis]|uniref:Serine-threonine/tyrosine-protein kinase catalytic domain-containing protein n=1 Tax=Rhizophagus irregularis TaxID=588596 RepID=A0A2N0NF75_9GLOM|nr:hypothetical protein RhiirA5_441903 [Rhizophagus irregularis]